MRVSREEQAVKARELMEALRIGWVPLDIASDFFANAYENSKIKDVIKMLEERHNVLVYYVTHENTSFGECYSFLYVSSYEEDLPLHDVRFCKSGEMIVLAYVWNVSKPYNSEFGSIAVVNDHGALVRVG